MGFINVILPVVILISYLKILKAGLQILDKNNYVIELKTLVNSIFILLLSILVLFVPIRSGIHDYFALAGLTIVGLLVVFLVWVALIKKINQPIYEKSVGLLKKFLATII